MHPHHRTIWLVLLAAVACGSTATSQPAPNAAILYRDAAAQLSDSKSVDELTQSVEAILKPAADPRNIEHGLDWASVTIDDKTRQLISDHAPILRILQQAALTQDCDWNAIPFAATATSDGETVPMVNRLILLGLLEGFAALELQQSEHDAQAASDWVDIIVLSRRMMFAAFRSNQVGDWPTISGLFKMEQSAIVQIAKILPRLSPVEMKSLAQRIDILPHPMPLAQTARKRWEALEGDLQKEKEKSPHDQPATRDDGDVITAFLVDVWKSIEQSGDLNPDQSQEKLLAALKSVKLTSSEARIFLGIACSMAVEQQAEYAALRAHREMLRAAVLYELSGPQAARQVNDPYGTGPFDIRKVGHGTELLGQLMINDKPVTLEIGNTSN